MYQAGTCVLYDLGAEGLKFGIVVTSSILTDVGEFDVTLPFY